MARAVAAVGSPLPRIDFLPEATHCPSCGGPLVFHKSQIRTIITLAEGGFEARVVFKRCAQESCPTVVGSDALARIVMAHQRFGYDLVVHVGLARYLGGKQRKEIRAELQEQHGIELAAGSVSALCDRFLLYFEALHLCQAPYLRVAMAEGYVLHVDATCDKGKGGLFICMDGVRGWVLMADRIPSENSDYLRPVVERTVSLFGKPVATVRDLSDAVAGAVSFLREQGIPDLVCHRHFLGAVGKKLFDKPSVVLRDALRANKVRTRLRALMRELRCHRGSKDHEGRFGPGLVRKELLALVLWLLEGTGKKNPDYPFSLPNLDIVQRCHELRRKTEDWVPIPRSDAERKAIQHLDILVAKLTSDEVIATAANEIEGRWQAFSELRDVLRLSNAELPGGDLHRGKLENPAQEQLRLLQIEKALKAYVAALRQSITDTTEKEPKHQSHLVILEYFDTYGSLLFGHPAIRDDDGNIIAIAERTNNPPEHLFGHCKRLLRRRLGRANLGWDMQQQPAQAGLVPNLRDPAYVRLFCGSLENLPVAFAALDAQTIREDALVRDHRDSELFRLLSQLLKASNGPLNSSPIDESPYQEGVTPTTI